MRVPLSTPDQLAQQIKSLRKARGLTQTDLGLRIGVKQARMAEIEAEPAVISVEQLFRLLHALGARIELDLDAAGTAPGVAEPEAGSYAGGPTPQRRTGW